MSDCEHSYSPELFFLVSPFLIQICTGRIETWTFITYWIQSCSHFCSEYRYNKTYIGRINTKIHQYFEQQWCRGRLPHSKSVMWYEIIADISGHWLKWRISQLPLNCSYCSIDMNYWIKLPSYFLVSLLYLQYFFFVYSLYMKENFIALLYYNTMRQCCKINSLTSIALY